MNLIRRLVLVVALCIVAPPAHAAPRAQHVFIISIDGGNPDEMARSEMPVLKKLVKQGAHTWDAQTITPSITLPAHASMLTGVGMATHKLTWNNWAPSNGVIAVPTIFTAAKKAGMSTAMFVGKEKFRHFLQPGVVDEFNLNEDASVVVSKSDSGGTEMKKEGNTFAETVARDAAAYIVKNKPVLTFIHFTDADTIGHVSGWGSPEQLKAFADMDAALGVVMKAIRKAGIAKESVVIISADHGGHERGHSKGLPADMRIPWIAWGKDVKKRFEITVPVGTCDTAATAFWLLDLKPQLSLEGTVVQSAFK